MLRAILRSERPVRADLVAAIHGLTEGNPFFVEEVLKSLLAVGEAPAAVDAWDSGTVSELRIPRTVQDAVQRRTARLRPESRHLLELAAIVGRRFDFALLQELAGADEPTLLAAIKELIAAQLVVEESADRFAFRHALTRQAVLAELLARERLALHRTIAETMERVYADALRPAPLRPRLPSLRGRTCGRRRCTTADWPEMRRFGSTPRARRSSTSRVVCRPPIT